ncbi:MAG: VOC family protein [Actinomycetota bacterium]|nr:VOC family protein [Actinomycetota bacterium]
MALRWYTVVVDCRDVAAQAGWWAEVLGWQKVYEADDEVVLVPGYLTEEMAREMPWERTPPGLVFVPVSEGKTVKNRLHIDLAPHTSDDRDAEIDRLLEIGAIRVEVEQAPDVSWTVLADPEGNEFCVLSSRDM